MKIAGSLVEPRTLGMLKIVDAQKKAQENPSRGGRLSLDVIEWAVELAEYLAGMSDYEKGVAIIDLIGILEFNKIDLSDES